MTTEHLNTPFDKFLSYWRVITRHWWQTLVGGSVCLLLMTVIIWKLPNEYEATTTILVDPQQVPEKYVAAAVNSDPGERLNTLTQQVLSRTRLQEIIDKFNLYSDLRHKVSDEEVVQQMRDHIRIQVRQGSGTQLSTFTITFQSSKPTVAADVANELAGSFIRWNISNREQQVEGTQSFLASELQGAKQNLEEQEDKLRVFKMSHLGETPDQTQTNIAAMTNLRAALQVNGESYNRLEQEKLLLTRLPQAAQPIGAADVSQTKRDRLETEKRQVESDLRRMREAYSDRYPDVIKLRRRLDELTSELGSLPADPQKAPEEPSTEVSSSAVRIELIDKELKRLKDEQVRLQSQISAYQSRIDATPLREQQLVELTRNYDVSKQHYQTLLDKSFNIEMAASLEQKQKAERFTVLDPAQVPEKPVKPRRKPLLLVALLLSATLPCIFVVGKELLGAKVTTEAELRSLIPHGARIVGRIPRIETAADGRRTVLAGFATAVACLIFCASAFWIIWHMRPLL
jgi:polysaccharide chain length determinant protein (PEP-CTERM system associated)